MLPKEKRMQVLEAYDLTKSFRAAGQLTGVDHHTVARAVAARAVGHDDAEEAGVRSPVAEPFVDKIIEWIERSGGRVRADVCHDKLRVMGYGGSARTTRRVVAALKAEFRQRHHRVYKPWITEPGAWLQYDFGEGPVVGGVRTVLFCAWLAWSRFRVVVPLLDRSLASVAAALDRTFRTIGGAPTYVLTDNERTVTDGHVAGVAVRNAGALALSRYYGVSIATCVPYDPESKGGSEATVRVAKADLVPTDYNLREGYGCFADLEAACAEVAAELNARPHALTRRPPAGALEVEQAHLHPIPDAPYTAAFGESRAVSWSATVSFRGARYSVPHTLAGGGVWVRVAGEEVVVVAGRGSGAAEVARHRLMGAGGASIRDEHYPHHRPEVHPRQPRPTRASEAAFLALGEGAKLYLVEAAACGARRIEARMAEAVALAALHGCSPLDDALGVAAVAGRFAEGDLASILVHASGSAPSRGAPPAGHSLAAGTSAWSPLGAGGRQAQAEQPGEDR